MIIIKTLFNVCSTNIQYGQNTEPKLTKENLRRNVNKPKQILDGKLSRFA